ncbi:glycine--tRNA ligase subunit beta [Candidatus Palibaumannia cicadellinicola]|uniref:Glycine--tRNA ligase beta subunit n=1 Tax=Candidatus Palibaumannia cicadellinicola TaxID=186490 RepID=A0A088MXG7_9GAMM|nr:glycine--tRNA ligase subunit beta [Candidatus Baumannia cicadellinicola]AIN47060.1 Glycyl-tRNA synthetase beta chain [Candidatus Baumannia cicadellinicola]
MHTKTFLVEIGTEELPAKKLRSLAQVFAANVSIELDSARISYEKINWFAAPRRLALKVMSMNSSAHTDSCYIEKRGPAVAQAFDAEGKPTKAAIGWARYCGITVNQAERLSTDKGEWLIYKMLVIAQPVQSLLCNIVRNALDKLSLSFPKVMRWGDQHYKFIRPVRTVTLLLDDQVIPGNILGINSDRIIRGHRFMGETKISLLHADCYPQVLLERGRVMADYELRKKIISHDVAAAAKKIGGIADINDSLLEEVTSLVEWPIVLIASFEEKFLAVPTEALVYTMINDQKYFPIYNTEQKLLPYFILVANIESKNVLTVIAGNEKVVRSRLADAEFFFNTDRKRRLEDNLSLLDTVMFQIQLGTLREKSTRIELLASWIAEIIATNVKQASRAGLLSKCDLMTNMVFEYPEIQGVIGMHYARLDGEPEYVALAQKEQYLPRFAGDNLPTTFVSCAVAIADKIDTLVGIFGINQHPKHDKDPFALRRAALGVLRIIVEKQLPLDLQALIEKAVLLYQDKLTNKAVVNDVINFMLNRLRALYQNHGYSSDTIHAVLAPRPTKLIDFDARIRALSKFRKLPDAQALTAINKRVFNILTKSQAIAIIKGDVKMFLLQEPEEINLMNYIIILRKELQPFFATDRYYDALVKLVSLRKLVDTLFDKVMIMTEKEEVRMNRLTLLDNLRQLFLQIADLALLQEDRGGEI